MKIKEILELLHTPGRTLNSVAKEVGIGEKRLRQALSNAGYEYSQSSKAYVFVAIDKDYCPEDESIEEFLKPVKSPKSNTGVAKSNTEVIHKEDESVISSNTDYINGNTEVIFNDEEVVVLKEFAGKLLREQQYQDEKVILHNRIKELERTERGRKTFAVSPKLDKMFVDFCTENKFQQADVLEIALRDLLRRYS